MGVTLERKIIMKSIYSISLLILLGCVSAQWTPLSDFPGTARRGSSGFMGILSNNMCLVTD